MDDCSIPSRTSDAYPYWKRAAALDAASRVMASLASPNTAASDAAVRTLTLAKRFEQYLDAGRTGPR